MHKRLAFSLTAACSMLMLIIVGQMIVSAYGANGLSSSESSVLSQIDGNNIYNYDLQLENIGLNTSISGYSFRSSGSEGANATAEWIKEQFESFGLATSMESFQFMTWNLPAPPVLTVDADGNSTTMDDQLSIPSFQSEQYSYPTPTTGVFAPLVILPSPDVSSRFGLPTAYLNSTYWNATDITGKILLIGREIQRISRFSVAFRDKITKQTPAAIVFTWWYDWMNFTPPMIYSAGGRPLSSLGPYFWNLKIPVGVVNYSDGLALRNFAEKNSNLTANLTIPAVVDPNGTHYNVVGELRGTANPEKTIIVSAHYDTVMTPGFCDNGAGTAGVIELARAFSKAYSEGTYKPQYTLIFVAFDGEELLSIGAVSYMKQHESQLKDVAAMINLDFIGSQTLEISETFQDDNGLNLENIVLDSASSLNVTARKVEPGGSDQEAFRNPAATDQELLIFWGIEENIKDYPRVKSSIMIDSYPLFYSDAWDSGGHAGWIHTAADSSETSGWITSSNLETHSQVAALSVMRVLSTIFNPVPLQVLSGMTAAIIAIGAVLYLKRSRAVVFFKNAYEEIRSYIGLREIAYFVLLTGIFMFLSVFMYVRIGRTEVIETGYPVPVNINYFGTPFEMFGNIASTTYVPTEMAGSVPVSPTFFQYPYLLTIWKTTDSVGGVPAFSPEFQGANVFFWQGFLLNLALYAAIAFVLVYAIARIKYRRQYTEG